MTAVDLSARLAEILADPSFEPELLARALADIDDTPRTLAESDERLARRKQRRADMGIAPTTQPPLKMPPRADKYDCLAFGASCRHTLMVDGTGIATPLPCGKCEPDREWRVFLKMVRYRHRVDGDQTIIRIMGFPDPDKVRQWASKHGRQWPGARISLIRSGADYLWEACIIHADALPQQSIAIIKRTMFTYDLRGIIETRPVTPGEFLALLPRDACVEGLEGVKRRTCVFTRWPDYEEEPSDCAQDDGVV